MSKSWIKREVLLEDLRVGVAVRNTVRNMAYNLENVITNLHGIVGDLHLLVSQIDSVASKMDTRNGFTKPENGIHQHLTQSNPVNGNSDSSSSKGFTSHNIQNWQDLLETCDNQDFSPDLDWSYLGLSGDTKHVKTLPEHGYIPVENHPLSLGLDLQMISKSSTTVLATQNSCTGRTSPEKCGINKKSCDNVHLIELIVPYDSYYEKAVDDVLENMVGEDNDSDFSDNETYSDVLTESLSSSIQSSDSSCSSIEFQAVYNRQMNPWTAFSSVVNALDSDDIFGSGVNTIDSRKSYKADDILNDNYIETKYFSCGLDSQRITNGLIVNNID